MEKTALRTIKKYNMIDEGDCIVTGVSGGADSMSLLYLLCSMREKMRLKIIAVHINHGVRGKEADEDEKYVLDVCKGLEVKTEVISIILKDEAKRLSMTEEEAGRKIRYDAFYSTAEKYGANKIAVAHNIDDNAETVLMRIFRGTGLKGLGGISPKRGIIIRPLIECSREIIEQYANKNKIDFRTDSTNTKEIYTRNKIRLRLIPWIRENFNSNIGLVISKNSAVMREENEYLDKIALESLNSVVVSKSKSKIELDCKRLLGLDRVILRRTIRLACINFSSDLHDISAVHIEKIIALASMQAGKKIDIPNSITVRKTSSCICIGYEKEVPPFCVVLERDKKIYVSEVGMNFLLSQKEDFSFKNRYRIYCDETAELRVRNRLNGDRIFLKGVGHKKLKNYFTDKKVPLCEKDSIPLIADGQNILCVCGYISSDRENETQTEFYIHFD